jgi:hypothetical protein
VLRDVPRLRAAKFPSRAGAGSRRAYSAGTPDLGEDDFEALLRGGAKTARLAGIQDRDRGGSASANLVRVAPERRKDCALRLCGIGPLESLSLPELLRSGPDSTPARRSR